MEPFKFNFVIPSDERDYSDLAIPSDGRDDSNLAIPSDGRDDSDLAIPSDGRSEPSKGRDVPSQAPPTLNDVTTSHCRTTPLEVPVQLFHKQLLSVLGPLSTLKITFHNSHPHSSQLHNSHICIGDIYYVTLHHLQTVLSAHGNKEASSEHISNSNCDDSHRTLTQLNCELGQLVDVADSTHSDLIPGVYEGGMKVWECAHDLIDYLVTEKLRRELNGSRVLDLGCGVGLLGIVSLLCGASTVHFQDYNREVISCLTVPSVIANLKQGREGWKTKLQSDLVNPIVVREWSADLSRVRFFFGDWAEFATMHHRVGESPYDIILTSETIYSLESQPKLLRVLKQLAAPKRGLVIVAAKSHYFGVGGSVCAFKDLVERDGHFVVEEEEEIEATIPRRILVLRPRESGE